MSSWIPGWRIRSGLALIRDSENSVFIRQLTYELDEHVLSYGHGLSNLVLDIPFYSTLQSGIWSTSSNRQLGRNNSSIICSISWPSSRFRLHVFPWWICAFGCRTKLVLYTDLLLPAERRFVPFFHLVLKKSNNSRVNQDPWTGVPLTNFRTHRIYSILRIGWIAKVVLRSLHVVEHDFSIICPLVHAHVTQNESIVNDMIAELQKHKCMTSAWRSNNPFHIVCDVHGLEIVHQ